MDQLTVIPLASIDSLTLTEAQERLQAAEEQRQRLEREMTALRRQIDTLRILDQRTQAGDQAPAAAPQSFDDLLGDASYQDDYRFEPGALDEERRSASSMRRDAFSRANGDVFRAKYAIDAQQRILQSGPEQIKALEGRIGDIQGSIVRRLWDTLVTGKREEYATQINSLEKQIADAPKRLADAQVALAAAQEKAVGTQDDLPYDVALHTLKADELLPRTQQSALVSFDPGRKIDTVTIRLPSGPDDTDYTRVARFDFSDTDDRDALMRLFGVDVKLRGSVFDTIGETVEYNFDFEDELVPMALEVVTVGGEKRLRLPQVVWERFGSAAVVE